MTESKRTAQVLKRFRELYPDGIAWKVNDRIARSRPDAVFFRQGRTTFVEFKVPPNTTTPGQDLELAKLQAAGFRVLVAYFLPSGKIVAAPYSDVYPGAAWTIDEFCRVVA